VDAEQVVTGWHRFKGRRSSVSRLDEPYQAEYEYQAMNFGHPSTHASVRFECLPAPQLGFEMGASWPTHLKADYRALLEDAMACAIVDVLLSSEVPASGCLLKCVKVEWDDIGSSELAFYRAVRGAMLQLREKGKWTVTHRRS
jgi:hypothetical protein